MNLRDHPLMIYRSVRNWPPTWTVLVSRIGSVKTVKGEVGVLRFVHSNYITSNKLFLVIEYQSETYVGCLMFRDHSFCTQISHLLRDHIGRSIKDIGELDVSHLL